MAVEKSREHYQAVMAGLSSSAGGQDETLAAQKIGGCGWVGGWMLVDAWGRAADPYT